MMTKKILLFIGGKNFNYVKNGLNVLIKYKKNINVLIITKNCSIEIVQYVLRKMPEKIIIKSNKPCRSKKNLSLIANNSNIGFNLGFNYIISKKILNLIDIVNLHPSYLPYNKGCHHSFWSIIDGTPPGSTLHWMSQGIDSGDIIIKRKIKINYISSAEYIQRESEKLCIKLLKESIDKILNGKITSTKQKKGNYHSKKEILNKTTLSQNQYLKADYLLKLIRATSSGDNGFYIKCKRKKIFIKIEKYEEVE